MIHAWCAHTGDVVTRTTLAALPRDRALMSASDTTVDVAGSVSSLSAFVPAEATASGHRAGKAPLPYVLVEHASRGGLVIERGGFGGRPAYVRCERDVVLASTDLTWVLDAARALGVRWSSSSLDPDRLAAECILDSGAVGRTETLFRGIREVPPGMRAELVPGRMTLTALQPQRFDETEERLRSTDGAAVEEALGREPVRIERGARPANTERARRVQNPREIRAREDYVALATHVGGPPAEASALDDEASARRVLDEDVRERRPSDTMARGRGLGRDERRERGDATGDVERRVAGGHPCAVSW